jgi:AcrR family transcriptional regulator
MPSEPLKKLPTHGAAPAAVATASQASDAAASPAAAVAHVVRLPRQRAPGRRRLAGSLDAQAVSAATRDDILQVATAEFARVGFEAASISAIAAQTRTSKRMLYYHFGGKEQLYAAVLEAAYARVRRVEPADGDARLEPMAALRQYAEQAFDSFMHHQDFVRLVLFENLAGAQVVRRSKTIAAISADNLQSLETIVSAGRQAGVMRSDFRVLDLFLTVVGMCFHAVSNRESVMASLRIDMLGDAESGLRRQLVAELVSRYASARP